MHIRNSFLVTAAAAALVAFGAQAGESVQFGVGYYNVFDDDENSAWMEVEYRAPYIWDKLQPIIGFAGNTDAALYGYAGFMYDWNIAGGWYMIPSLAVGAYGEGDDSKDLGGALEFRSRIETAYEFDGGYRAGLALMHLSNAHIYDKNPGTEMLVGTFTIPIGQ